MNNDAVRWSMVPNAQNAQNNVRSKNNYNNGGSNFQAQIHSHVARNSDTRQHVARNTNTATNGRVLLSTTAAASDCKQVHTQQQQQQQYCDINTSFLNPATYRFLVNKRNNKVNAFKCNAIRVLAATTNSRHLQQQCLNQQHHNQPARQQQYAHQLKPRIFAWHLNRILLNCLQLSVVLVFLLCTLNVGFVSVPSAYAALATDNNAAAANVVGRDGTKMSAPFHLDYEDEGSGRVDGAEHCGHYTDTWAVHVPNGDNGVADQVAKDHGFVKLGKIFPDCYHFAHHKVSKRSLTPSAPHQIRLDNDDRVQWAKQQQAKTRRKRDFIRMRPSRTSPRTLSLVDTVPLNDPKWAQMWYLNRGGGLDMNVVPAWKEGITGKGIVVTILDDGLESDHPDIEHNYDPDASYDVNSHDNDPMPHYDMTDSNRHGTRCAGEVAATANNSFCAVGIAFGASVGGVRMLDGDVTDAVEARSLSLNPQHIDIYSASWGPDDDGKTVDGPGELAQRAFIEGVTKGRQGKGSIFIWASGNGGRELDNCNCDGYTNSIWTLSISSATEEGHVPWYSEKCSSTLATTYSSGGQSEKQVVTTDLHHSCTVSHTGTSASAPLAAGIAALVLESNTNLTWRDLQHIVVRTAKPANLRDPTWSKNGVGRRVSHSFGYGLMDAAAMVKVARVWKTVPEQQRCEINAPHVDKVIPPRSYITLQLTVKHCSSVNYLEHVQAKITLTSQRRGDIQLNLKSPAGTKVTLLTSRVHDVSRSGFNQWPFMSVHTWGESPHGNWQLEIHNEGRYMAQITQWDLIFYGTETPAQPDDPIHISAGEFGNEMGHNNIEYDANSQWRNMQQVGESSVTASDKTNTSCLKLTIDQRCLECAVPTFLFDSRCYDQCPIRTYPIFSKSNNNNFDGTDSVNTFKDTTIPNSSMADEDELQSVDRRRRKPKNARFYAGIDNVPNSASPQRCDKCDNSCLRCYGPLSTHCSTCPAGSQLRKMAHTNDTYCYTFAERSSGNSHDGFYSANVETIDGTEQQRSGGRMSHTTFFILLAMSTLVLSIIAVFVWVTRRKNVLSCLRGGTGIGASNATLFDVGYDRLALLAVDETDEVDADVESSAAVCVDYREEVDSPATIENAQSRECVIQLLDVTQSDEN